MGNSSQSFLTGLIFGGASGSAEARQNPFPPPFAPIRGSGAPREAGWWGWLLLHASERFTLGQPEHLCCSTSPSPVGVCSVLLLHPELVPALLALLVSLVLASRSGHCAAPVCASGEGVGSLGQDFDVSIC